MGIIHVEQAMQMLEESENKITFLLGEIEKKNTKIASLETDLIHARRVADERQEIIDSLKKAIEFYAVQDNWENDTLDIGVGNIEIPNSSQCCVDGGEIARNIIGEINAARL